MARVRPSLFLILLLVNSTASLAINCSNEMDDKPALSILQELKQNTLLGSDEIAVKNTDILNDIYNQYKSDPRRQLQFALTFIRSRRNEIAVNLAAQLQRHIENLNQEFEQMARERLEQTSAEDARREELTFGETIRQQRYIEQSPEELMRQVKSSPDIQAMDDLVVSQILQFKDQYFDPNFVTAIDTRTLFTNDFIVAIAHERDASFKLPLNVDGKRQNLEFYRGQVINTQGTYPVKIRQLANWSSETPEWNGTPIYFYRVEIIL